MRQRWIKDLVRFLPLKPQFVLSGNIRDLHTLNLPDRENTIAPLRTVLAQELADFGYHHGLYYNIIDGLEILALPGHDNVATQELLTKLEVQHANGAAQIGLDGLGGLMDRVVKHGSSPVALIIDFASRLAVRHDALTAVEHAFFTRALTLSHSARPMPFGPSRQGFFNTVLWIVDRDSDLPDWLTVANPRIRSVPLTVPDRSTRLANSAALLRALQGAREAPPEELQIAAGRFADSTDGLLLLDMKAIVQLAQMEKVQLSQISEAVRRYKIGVVDDPWKNIDRDRIRNGLSFIQARVKGQDHAAVHMLDIIKRAITGAGAGNRTGQPRGVAFLAGPTGVGKTELAKTVTSLLFGDESAYIRFDMSEFSESHADQRLIGAPPGYIGYDAGGELTNAVREKPFSVILFDEIEKAHPLVLDKFLQMLDDGVLTSGRGDKVWFSEALIIFTSNLGIYRTGPDGRRIPNASATDTPSEMKAKVLAEIQNHFKLVLNRPEILNRIGENVIVFDFISPEIADQIFDQRVDATLRANESLGISLSISPAARESLRRVCLADLGNGGRGIRNKIDAHLVNPLSRALFDENVGPSARLIISGLDVHEVTTLTLEPVPA